MSESIKEIVIRVPKEESAFTYFQLEANEGLCFYSTLESSMGQPYRDIEIKASPSTFDEVLRLLDILKEQYPIEFLT